MSRVCSPSVSSGTDTQAPLYQVLAYPSGLSDAPHLYSPHPSKHQFPEYNLITTDRQTLCLPSQAHDPLDKSPNLH